ncbi:secondary thiamine-phosphate synthase enzyme YjbQ [Thalassotalea mangrovi]|uniref:YjbQ family protein n=1 Tax=Thalassotalea mangrovi TaxID=2572245 RepID=A0A4U1B6S6_9GAMM|nr:secondary thiamine-phosphate synthase enzyme YjbQ [Thalassotalea mangrovi]TKB46168.1 YjbQ family protein [Thalassotalea mangrovi]
MWQQQIIQLAPKTRGFHLITDDIYFQVPQIGDYKVGMLHLFLRHTSASLSINENADPMVRQDLESHFNTFVPENQPYYLHDYEGPDDMPAHIKSSILGCELTIPITNGRFAFGTWQGIYLCEHRNHGGSRSLVATLNGEV